MSKTLAVIFLMQIGNLFSQFAFFNEYPTNQNMIFGGSIEVDNYFISCGVVQDTNGSTKGVLSFVEKNGELNKRVFIDNFYLVGFSSIINLNDGIIVAGYTADLGLNNYVNYLWKFDFSGTVQWEKPFGNYAITLNDNISPKLLRTQDGFLAFTSDFGAVKTEAEVVKFDFNGNIEWSRLFSSELNEFSNEMCIDAALCTDGVILTVLSSYFLQGLNTSSYLLLKIDFFGNEIWRKGVDNIYLGSFDITENRNQIHALTSGKNGGFIAVFCSEDEFSKSFHTVVTFFDNDGNLIKAQKILENRDVDPYLVTTNQKDELFIMGQDNTDYGTNSFLDLFIAKFNNNFEVIWENKYGFNNSNDLWSSGILTNDGGTLVGGSKFRNTSPFGYNHFLVKTDCEGNTIWDGVFCNSDDFEPIILFPNPTDGLIYIQFNSNQVILDLDVMIYDEYGRELESQKAQIDNKITLDLTYLANGVYLVNFYLNGNKVVKRIIVQK